MRTILTRCNRYRTRAFTLLESLLVLGIICLLTLTLSVSVNQNFQQVEEQLFFMEFEYLYRDSQKISLARQEAVRLQIAPDKISNGYQSLEVPASIQVTSQVIEFNRAGGNSSLAKIVFETPRERVSYQLYIGSGNYKKSSQSLHSP